MIIGVTGLIGTGKDEASRYISSKYGFTILDYSSMIGEMLWEMGLSPERENKRRLRKERGNTFVAEEVVRRIKEKENDNFILTSLRRPEDIEIPKNEFNGVNLIILKASDKIRFDRLMKRNRDKPKNWDDFLQQDKKEEEIFNFTKTFTYGDYLIDNDSSLEELHKKIDLVMKEILETK